MFRWFRRAAGRWSRAAGAVEEIKRIESRVVAIEKAQQEVIALLTEKAWGIDKVIIENLHTEKVELNLDTVDVKDLSGMLSIGINYGGSLVKVSREAKGEESGAGSPGAVDARAVEKYTGLFAMRKKDTRAAPPSPEPNRPAINVVYGVRPDEKKR